MAPSRAAVTSGDAPAGPGGPPGGPAAEAAAAGLPRLGAPSRPFLRGLLLRRSAWIEARVIEGARRNGYAGITPAMSRMFGCMRGQPIGLSEIARSLGTSRQAVHQLASEAARMGLVELLASERDARVKLVRFTTTGWEMSERAARDFAMVEDALAERIGRRDLEDLRRILAKAWAADEVDPT